MLNACLEAVAWKHFVFRSCPRPRLRSVLAMSVVGRIFCTRSSAIGSAVRQLLQPCRTFSVSASSSNVDERRSYRVVVVGGGTAGCSVARKFASHFGKGNVAVVEPTDVSKSKVKVKLVYITVLSKAWLKASLNLAHLITITTSSSSSRACPWLERSRFHELLPSFSVLSESPGWVQTVIERQRQFRRRKLQVLYPSFLSMTNWEAVCVNNLPKVATQWNSGETRDSKPGHRARIPSALTTTPLSHTVSVAYKVLNCGL